MTSDDEPVNAPERVWLAPDLGDDWSILKVGDAIYWEGVDRHHPDDCETEYVRADIAAARIRELEAELEALKSDLSGYMSAANTYANELHGVHSGTHVIVPAAKRIRELEAERDSYRIELGQVLKGIGGDNPTHVIVPVEPTEKMIEAGFEVYRNLKDLWKAMIRAAQPNAKPQQGE